MPCLRIHQRRTNSPHGITAIGAAWGLVNELSRKTGNFDGFFHGKRLVFHGCFTCPVYREDS